MNMNRSITMTGLVAPLMIAALPLLASCAPAHKSFREVPDPSLRDIAVIRQLRGENSVVIYNPVACREIGVACGFFRSQAFAHRRLNHLILDIPSAYPPTQRAQADCWAARYGDAREVAAAVRFLEAGDEAKKWRVPGDLAERARNIRECAAEAGNWPATE